jgi:hypothetical protein
MGGLDASWELDRFDKVSASERPQQLVAER